VEEVGEHSVPFIGRAMKRGIKRGKTVVGGGLLLPTFLKPKRGGGKGDGEVPIQWGKGKAARWRFISTASEHGRVNDSGVRCGSAG
jgi:hypothetical protein